MAKPSSEKNNGVGTICFFSPKVNVKARLEFEFAYLEALFQHTNHNIKEPSFKDKVYLSK